MDTMLGLLVSWQFILFGLSIAAIVFLLRTCAEYLLANSTVVAKEAGLWNNLILPISPIVIGPLAAYFFKTFPYPDGLGDGRILFGLVAGLFSSLLYRIFKSLLMQKLSSVLPKDENIEEDPQALANKVKDSIQKE